MVSLYLYWILNGEGTMGYQSIIFIKVKIKGALSSLKQFLAAESSLKMMKKCTSKALFVLKIFKFLSWLSGRVAKWLDKKNKLNFKFYDVTAWLTKNCNAHTAQTIKFGQFIECNMRNIFLEKPYAECGGETSPRPFSEKLKLSISLDQ